MLFIASSGIDYYFAYLCYFSMTFVGASLFLFTFEKVIKALTSKMCIFVASSLFFQF